MWNVLDRIALLLIIIGGINWGLVGLFQFDLVAWIFGGSTAIGARVLYVLIAIGALWSLRVLFAPRPAPDGARYET